MDDRRPIVRGALTASVLSLAAVGPSWAEGPGLANVLGSDTVMLNGTIFQFDAADGVELHQPCFVDGQPWACGVSAMRSLQTLLDGVMVTCEPTGEKSGDAELAVCTSEDGQDVGEYIVRQGWAMADRARSDAYASAEQEARDNQAGIWRGSVVEPWAFREDVAAIEETYLEEASASILAEAQQELVTGEGLGPFAGADVGTAEPGDGTGVSDREVRVAGLAAGFVLDAIPAQEAFSWPVVAHALEEWRRSSIGRVVRGARNPVWEGLLERPRELETADNERAYYRAIGKRAAPLIEQGRQPVLFVSSPTLPDWIGDWFHGSPPDGAQITKEPDIDAEGYMGTVDGVDVYIGTTPGTDSILFPADLLMSARYQKHADGNFLTLDRDAATTEDELVFRYSLALEWKPDAVVRLHYPFDNNE